MKYLFIVESPTKASTLKKILSTIDPDNEYIIKATLGHLRDLDKKRLSINMDDGAFTPSYVNLDKKKHIVAQLKLASKDCDAIFLASDNDREGESIAWHCLELLKKVIRAGTQFKRIVFNELTNEAIITALEKATVINMNLVNSQTTRRIIDRLVGFKMTPFLWKEFDPKLSSGRVQTATLKLIVDLQESETNDNDGFKIKIMCSEYTGTSVESYKLEEAKGLLNIIFNANYTIHTSNQQVTKRKEKPCVPFNTSTLQQAAYDKFGQGISKTMEQAQELYELGLITYIRTTSTSMSSKARSTLDAICKEKKKAIGGNSDEEISDLAHEAIRPTFQQIDIAKPECKRLFNLIYERAMKSRLSCKNITETSFQLSAICGTISFMCKSRKKLCTDNVVFKLPTNETYAQIIGAREEKQLNEGSLIALLDKCGIGRPSTYVSILDRLYKQKYIRSMNVEDIIYSASDEKKRKRKIIVPTALGIDVVKFLEKQFAEIVDPDFTRIMEFKLDEIENGNICMKDVLQEFWLRFSKILSSANLTTNEGETEKTSNQSSTFVYHINNLKYQVRTTRFGPVIEYLGEKKLFISLNSYLAIKQIGINDLTKNDVAFLLSFPRPLPSLPGCHVNYGRFGFYITDENNQSISIPKEWFDQKDISAILNFSFV